MAPWTRVVAVRRGDAHRIVAQSAQAAEVLVPVAVEVRGARVALGVVIVAVVAGVVPLGTAPDVLVVLAEMNPEILLPMVPDMTRLTADPGLKEGLTQTLETVAEKCPGQVGERLSRSLQKRFRKGSAF